MSDKVNDQQVTDLLALIRTDASVDTKVRDITTVKSAIKQNNVPDTCVQNLFEICRLTLQAQQTQIVNAGFTTLTHLLTRLSRQEPKHLLREAARTLPFILDKIGDTKDKYRLLGSQCLTTFWGAAALEVERAVKAHGLVGKHPRQKEACMKWLVSMHVEQGMPFKPYVTTLMELLEDADGMVRDVARNTVIELFENAPPVARSDLKRQLKAFDVRPAITNAILNHLSEDPSHAEAQHDSFEPEQRHQFASSVTSQAPSLMTESTSSESRIEHVDPSYVNTHRELEEVFRDMHPFFEGKESEANWLKREQSCTKLRRLNAGNAFSDFRDSWISGIKGLLDGLLKAVNSLRTSLSKEGCHLVQEMTLTAGPAIDSMVEILLQNLIKLCGGTKKIASQAGDATVDIIVSKVTYNTRILSHIWAACQDKNVQPRTYAAGWLKTLLKKEMGHKSHVEHTGGLDIIEKCIKKGLADANPGVREKMRSTYWTFAQIWSAKAEAIMATLDGTQQKLLEKDPGNPRPQTQAAPTTARPGMGFSKSTMAPPKPSLRETLIAQKKAAMAAKAKAPSRPGSAMASYTPAKSSFANTNVNGLSSSHGPDNAKAHADEKPATHQGLSVKPMRPAKARPRPEIARPATAGPYSVRRIGTNGRATPTDNMASSPTNSRVKTSELPVLRTPPTRNSAKPTTNHARVNGEAHNTPIRAKTPIVEPALAVQHRSSSPTPAKSPETRPSSIEATSPGAEAEGFTMVLPKIDLMKVMETSSPAPAMSPLKSIEIFNDPVELGDAVESTQPSLAHSVLEEVSVNEDVVSSNRQDIADDVILKPVLQSPDRVKQNNRLIDSGIEKIKSKTLDVHGFRKLQSLIRENKVSWTNEKFEAMLLGLCSYLESPSTLSTEKIQDVKVQMLSTIKLMLKKEPEAFKPHVPTCIKSLINTRSMYDSRSHISSGLEILAQELVRCADPHPQIETVTSLVGPLTFDTSGCRAFEMSLHILKELFDASPTLQIGGQETQALVDLAMRCLESTESGVRMDATQLCVSLHANLGEERFWEALGDVREDPKSLITYYIVKRQREAGQA